MVENMHNAYDVRAVFLLL